MNDFTDAVGKGGKRMSRLGIATMSLGFLAMLAPILVAFSLLWILGLLVVSAGLVRMLWAFQTGSLGEGVLVFAIAGLTLLGERRITTLARTPDLYEYTPRQHALRDGIPHDADGAPTCSAPERAAGVPGGEQQPAL